MKNSSNSNSNKTARKRSSLKEGVDNLKIVLCINKYFFLR